MEQKANGAQKKKEMSHLLMNLKWATTDYYVNFCPDINVACVRPPICGEGRMPWRPVACVLPDICAAGFPLHIPFPRVIDQSVILSLSLPLSLSSSLFFILYPRKPPICRSVNCVADEAACRARDRSENGERRKVKTRNGAAAR